jgi:pimeloyl-ACP methyl ester carboxylesterase
MWGVSRALAQLAAKSRTVLRPVFAAQEFLTRHWPERVLQSALRQLPPPDAAVLGRDEERAAFVEEAKKSSASTAKAATQDFAIFTRDWGFRLDEITVPVHVWHGDADRNVPMAHGRFQAAAIPGSSFHDCPGEGHLLAIDHIEEILRTVSSAQPKTS